MFRELKDFLRQAGQVTYADVQRDGTGWVLLCGAMHATMPAGL